ncbi:MAG: hypothetical protein IJS60_06380 [Abditibacteriota bacterium]|nr:hypothetical protein [Abditibacteriota bacterium]
MSNEDFIIEDGVLKEYKGKDTDVVIPEGVTCIGNMALCEGLKLTTLEIPKSVTKIEEEAFF